VGGGRELGCVETKQVDEVGSGSSNSQHHLFKSSVGRTGHIHGNAKFGPGTIDLHITCYLSHCLLPSLKTT
jgi:hypothetical protein